MKCWCFFIFILCGVIGRNGVAVATSTCNFPAIFNFGDSNSETGGQSAAFVSVPPPNGETFFHKPSGRSCDGRLIIDFIAEHLGIPYLTSYLDSVAADFRKGANFAVGGASIKEPVYGSIALKMQIYQFQQFKAKSIALYKQDQELNSSCKPNIPEPDSFPKALYTFDIGQNDLAYGLKNLSMSESQLNASIPELLDLFSTAINTLYREGARVFWIHNTGPFSCLPSTVIGYCFKSGNQDKNGCVKSLNEIAREFNSQLKDKLVDLENQLPDSIFTYVDVYSVKYAQINGAKQHGFTSPLKYCCGDYRVYCGHTVTVNGTTVYGSSCSNPSRYISWDGIHYSEAANHWIFKQIINGSLSQPPVAVDQSCHKPLKA